MVRRYTVQALSLRELAWCTEHEEGSRIVISEYSGGSAWMQNTASISPYPMRVKT